MAVVEAAAILGREFDAALLPAALGGARPRATALRRALDLGLLAPRTGCRPPAVRARPAWFAGRGFETLAGRCRSLARRADPSTAGARGQSAVAPHLQRLGVTSRELDVLALLTEGLTNRQIAERLFVSPRTVKGHVEHLLAKTGATNRTQLAALALAGDDRPQTGHPAGVPAPGQAHAPPMNEHPNTTLVRTLVDAFAPGDLAAVGAPSPPTRSGIFPAARRSPASTRARGDRRDPGQVLRAVGRHERLELIEILGSDWGAVQVQHVRAARDGRTLDCVRCWPTRWWTAGSCAPTTAPTRAPSTPSFAEISG